jgi:catechol 2,3-dioxygenase-like lactoylglutathione lyase family enzyme
MKITKTNEKMRLKSFIIPLFILVLTFKMGYSQKQNAKEVFEQNHIQIGIVAQNLEETLNFYTNVLGMKKVSGFSVNDDFSLKSGLANGTPFEVTVLQLNDNKDSSIIKVMSFNNKTKEKNDDFIKDDLGVRYFTIHVKALEPYIERLKKNKILFLGKTPLQLNKDNQFVAIQDPNGIFIELIGPY